MRHTRSSLFAGLLLLVSVAWGQPAQVNRPAKAVLPVNPPPIVNVYFPPKDNCTGLIIDRIRSARRTILVMMYDFADKDIADALIQAHRNGVFVEVIIEPLTSGAGDNTQAYNLRDGGVNVRRDGKEATFHHKVAIIDSYLVITGSFNYSKTAQNGNAENLVVLQSSPIANQYTQEFALHQGHGPILQKP
jgi:phosphatidylserine/phosphatidylglycerophosphate/cardiolipin synthase-like enzyme